MKTSDSDIRAALHSGLLAPYHADPDAVVIDEMGLDYGTNRVDIAVVNGSLHGYEIKSDRDTLVRLRDQVAAYKGIFDRLTVVCGPRYADRVKDMLPSWIEVRSATLDENGNMQFPSVRRGSKNRSPNPVSLARLLWREEAVSLLQSKGITRGLSRANKYELCLRIAAETSKDDLQAFVRQCLKNRARLQAVAQQM